MNTLRYLDYYAKTITFTLDDFVYFVSYTTDDNMTIVLQLSSVVTAICSADFSDVTERVRGRVGQCLL